MSNDQPSTIHGMPRAEVFATGSVNGMGETDPEGPYVAIVVMPPTGPVSVVRLSKGSASVLAAELGALSKGAEPAGATPWDWDAPLSAPLRLARLRKEQADAALEAELAAWVAAQVAAWRAC